METITIRRLSTLPEYQAMEAVQREVWDQGLVIASPHLVASVKCGGIALGAFAGAGAVGFCYGFPARKGPEVWFHSHMLAVLPAYRGRDIGYRLKIAQRQAAREEGYTRVSWTFDPLQLANARLNLNKLGAVGAEYLEDYYGEMEDPLNRGLPTDRLLVNWHIASDRAVGGGSSPAGARAVNRVDLNPAGLPESSSPDLSREDDRLLVYFPADFAAIRAGDPALALDWRLKTRAVLSRYLGAGYRATGVLGGEGGPACYLLERS